MSVIRRALKSRASNLCRLNCSLRKYVSLNNFHDFTDSVNHVNHSNHSGSIRNAHSPVAIRENLSRLINDMKNKNKPTVILSSSELKKVLLEAKGIDDLELVSNTS